MENGVSLGQSPIAFLSAPASAALALGSLSEGVASWFRHRHGQPTLIQRHAWPEIPRGNHLLLSAPTGTGKTLAAFLPVLDQLLYPPAGDPWAGLAAGISCLYISPLRALCNDVLRSLREVGDSLRPWLPEHASLPRLGLRTGDTSAGQRQHLREDPPAILLTTPESLAILLSLPSMQPALTTVRWVIVDEVHALAGSKRGADLALSLERLQDQSSQEMQRIGLSATATPLPEAARYLVGVGRPCRIARVADQAPLEISVTPLPGGRTFLADLINHLAPVLPHQRSTLIFTNTRGLAERLGWGLRRALLSWDRQIAVHHSALAASRREEVEAAFKRGQLRVVVSSTSLELGIDIGSVDLVVLVHPPGDVIRLLQRVGRSGHAPQDASGAFRPRRGLLLTDSPAELLEAVVTVASGRAGQYEPLQLVVNPLDVLCQQLVGMAMARWWSVAEAYALCRRATPFRDLTREDFEEALAYLLGRDQEGEAWLPARLREDGDGFLIRDEGTARLLRRNLGTILGEDTVAVLLRDDPSGETGDEFPEARAVGNVDQAFADRLQPGDRFLLDGRCLQVRERESEGLTVTEVVGRPRVPRWGGEGWPLSTELAGRVYTLRSQAAEALREGPACLAELLRRDYGLEGAAISELLDYFEAQEQRSEIPEPYGLLIEAVASEQSVDCYLHTPLNRPGNDALARVAVLRLARDHGRSVTSQVADLGLILSVPGVLADPAAWLRTVLGQERFLEDLHQALAENLALRLRFQQVACTGLMLLRQQAGRRARVGGPDWGGRELFEQVRTHHPDFVLIRQAMRELRQSVCDGHAALAFARQLAHLPLRCRWLAQPSPFAQAWTQRDTGPSGTTESPAQALARLHATLLGATRGAEEEPQMTRINTDKEDKKIKR